VSEETPEDRFARLAETKNRRERTRRILEEPGLIDIVCSHVTSGGSHIDLCETWSIRYSDLMAWIREEKTRIDQLDKALYDRGEWVEESILRELRRLGSADLRKLFKEDGSLKKPEDWPDEIAAAISGIDTEELFDGYGKYRKHIGFTKKVKLWDKGRALELLGKNLRMFVDRVDVSGKVSLADLVKGSMKNEGDGSK
jgi:hypothetical protein